MELQAATPMKLKTLYRSLSLVCLALNVKRLHVLMAA